MEKDNSSLHGDAEFFTGSDDEEDTAGGGESGTALDDDTGCHFVVPVPQTAAQLVEVDGTLFLRVVVQDGGLENHSIATLESVVADMGSVVGFVCGSFGCVGGVPTAGEAMGARRDGLSASEGTLVVGLGVAEYAGLRRRRALVGSLDWATPSCSYACLDTGKVRFFVQDEHTTKIIGNFVVRVGLCGELKPNAGSDDTWSGSSSIVPMAIHGRRSLWRCHCPRDTWHPAFKGLRRNIHNAIIRNNSSSNHIIAKSNNNKNDHNHDTNHKHHHTTTTTTQPQPQPQQEQHPSKQAGNIRGARKMPGRCLAPSRSTKF